MPPKAKPSLQEPLFGNNLLTCPGMENIPLIVDPHVSAIEVLAPGSVYQPLLLDPRQEHVDVGPGKLDEHEEAFVRDLVRRLYPAGDHPKGDQTPLKWGPGGRQIWLKRNIEKRDESFRLRVDDSDWFYPDFIVWIIDPATRTQTFGFVDPKGLTLGAGGGWSDYKIVSALYMPHMVERQLAAIGQKVEFEGEEWTFRVRGVLVSTSSLASLSAQAKFNVNDPDGADGARIAPGEEDFKRGRIVFQKPHAQDKGAYIDDVLRLLTEDSIIDDLLGLTARLFDNQTYVIPSGELEHDLALRHDESSLTESEFVAALIQDYLRPDASGSHESLARRRRHNQLHEYAAASKWGLAGESSAALHKHPTPCEELWKRKKKAAGK